MNDDLRCPVCGGQGHNAAPTPSDLEWVECGTVTCPFYDQPLPVAAWNRLSDAAALLRAVERLETLAPHGSGRTIECYATHAAVLDWQASRMAVDAAVVREVDGAPTLAAALITLAGEVSDA